VKLAEKAVRLEQRAENYFVLGWACDLNGEAVYSLAAMEKAIQLAPNNVRYKQAYEQAKKKQ
jgi:cytochrome c-type biogenesis protein CcmH/NrfG